MLNILIIDNDLNYVKNILNNTLNKFSEIHLSHIATTIKEAKDIIANNSFDLIFLDLKFPDGNGLELISYIKSLNNFKSPKIIIVSNQTSIFSHIKGKYNNIDMLSKLQTDEDIYNNFKKIISNINFQTEEYVLKNNIINDLTYIGFDLKYKGTQYIIEAILYIYKNNNLDLLDNLEQNVYKYIAFNHKKSINNIKTNIIKSTKIAYLRKSSKINQLYYIKPTPKFIISNIIAKYSYIQNIV